MKKAYLCRSLGLIFLVIALLLDTLVKAQRGNEHLGLMSIVLGSAPNFIAAAFVSLAISLFYKLDRVGESIFLFCTGLIIYEFAQVSMNDFYFDIYDIIATILGFFVAISLSKFIIKAP